MNISGDIFLFVNTYSTLKIQQQKYFQGCPLSGNHIMGQIEILHY